MKIDISANEDELGAKAGRRGAELLRAMAQEKERLTLVVPTGASQFCLYKHLIREPDIPWDRVDAFHLDEYVGISVDHPGSFRRYLRDRFVSQVPALGSFEEIVGDAPDIDKEIARINKLMQARTIDLCFAGIGDNGHVAFNDPPADLTTEDPYICVQLDRDCRQQQFNEGWFESWDAVPTHAVSMSVRQIMKSRHLIVSVPGTRKAKATKASLESEVTPDIPASILKTHAGCELFLDRGSASLLDTGGHA